MQYSDWKMISTFSLVLGAVLVLGGGLAYTYYNSYTGFGISLYDYPYRNFAIPLLIPGVVLLVLGAVTGQRAKDEPIFAKPTIAPVLGFCPNCGLKRDSDSLYCKKCGHKF
jgi:hypothetical protein